MKTKIGFILMVSLFITGCANISTLSRTTILPPRGNGPITGTGPQSNQVDYSVIKESGLAIHLDAPQRLVFSKNGRVCAEPSPDALQAFAASQGVSVLTPSNVSVQVANALATSAGSIGLRTQSITLMRDHLYRICEAAYSDLLTEFDVAQLIRRSQDLTLGVLAIEQLSGTVKAQQVAISTKSNADASANLAATQASLAVAREKESLAKSVSDAAAEKKDTQAAILKAKQALVDNPPTGQDLAKLQEDRDKAQTQLGLDTAAAADAKKNYDDTQKVSKKIEENLGKAFSTASASAEGSTQFSGVETIKNINDSTSAQHISWAATQIVEKIINKDHTIDSCISLLNKFAKSELEPEAPTQRQELKQKLEKLEAERKNVIDEKNALEFANLELTTEFKVNRQKLDPAQVAQSEGVIDKKRLRIGQLHEEKAILDYKIQDLRGIFVIRELCVGIIQDHLQRQKKEQEVLSKK